MASLDYWLIRRAKTNQFSGASRTFVVRRGHVVQGYYALAEGAIDHRQAPGRIHRNVPDPIPAVVLGRLAVATAEQGAGVGRALVRDALVRVRTAANEIGVAAVLVHALNERARCFYLDCGLVQSPIDPLVLLARLSDLESAL